MLTEEIKKIEDENQHLKVLLGQMLGDIPRPKNCGNCRNYTQHYIRDDWGGVPQDSHGALQVRSPNQEAEGEERASAG